MRRGLSVMEVVIAMAISVLLGTTIYQYTAHSGKRYRQTVQKAEAQKDLLLCVKHLQSDLTHLRDYQAADARYYRPEIPNLFAVDNRQLSFATNRGEKITYRFDPGAFEFRRGVEPLQEEELTIPELIWQKVKERADATFSMVTGEIQRQIDEKVAGFKDVFNLGDPAAAGDPLALTQKCTEIFDKISYYTGTDGSDSPFVQDLQATVTGKAEEMALEVAYGVEADAEEIMGTLLTRFFQVEDLAPPKINTSGAMERVFPIKSSYRVLLGEGQEKAPDELSADERKKILGFRVFLESPNPISTLEQFYQKSGMVFIPNALVLKLETQKSQWYDNPPPRVKLKIVDLITDRELSSRYYGEAIIPDADILYRTWVEIPEFWFLDIFNTEEKVNELRRGLINPDDAEPKK